MTEPPQQTLARIASHLNGTLLAYTPMSDDPRDHRHTIAYRPGEIS